MWPLEEQFLKTHDPRPCKLQLYSRILAMMFDEEIEAWNRVDLAYQSTSILEFLLELCMNSDQNQWSKAWFSIYYTQWFRIWKKNARLCEEISSFGWEKNFDVRWKLDLKMVNMIKPPEILLCFSIYMLS